MTRYLLLLIAWCCITYNLQAQVSIGTGTSVGQALPIEPYFGYTYSQSIYLASEIGATGTITGLKYYATPSTTLANSDSITVYIGHTTRTDFANTTDWEAVSNLIQSFVGVVSISGGEMLITLNTPFNYNGTDNLLIAMEEDRASYDGTNDDFYCTAVTGNRSITYRSDGTNPDPATPPTASGLRQYIPNIQFQGITQACPAPTNLSVSNLTTTTVDLGWTQTGGVTSWDVEWDTVGFTQGTGTMVTGTATNPHTLTGLTANTTYSFYVRANCGSAWAGPFTFTTPCNVYTPAYLEDFTTFVPACWEEAGAGNPATGPSDLNNNSLWNHTSYLNAGSVNDGAKINLYTTTATDWLLSPTFDLSSGTWELVINVGLTDYNSAAAGTMGSDDTVQVLVSTNNGVSWTPLYTWDVNNQPPTAGQAYIIDLSAYTGATNRFAIWATDGTVDDLEDYDFHIGDFEIRTPPSCAAPTNLSVSNITATTADLGWMQASGATLWDIEWDTVGFTQGTGTMVTGTTTNPHTLTGLTANTTYSFYVRADCGAIDGVSTWAGPFTFTTICPTFYTAPYSEDFENAGAIPLCWNQGASNSENWLFANTASGKHVGNNGTTGGTTPSGGYFAWIDDSTPDNTGTTLESPLVDVSGLASPMLSFYLISNNEGNHSNVDFSVDVWDGAAWNTGFYTHNTNTANGEWEQIFVDISTLTITGPIQLRFIVDEPSNGDFYDDVAIDDVELKEAPSCIAPVNLSASNLTATTADLGWMQTGGATLWDIEWGATGFTQGTGTMVTGTMTNPYNLTGLTPNTTYSYYVRADCGAVDGVSLWAGPFTFTTTVACPDPTNLSVSNITATTVDLAWMQTGGITSWDVEWDTVGFTQGTGTMVTGTATNPHTLTGLTANTTYSFYVRANCGSAWAGPFTFTTACSVYTPAYLEDFTTFVPTCWEEAGDGNPTTGPSDLNNNSLWNHTDYLNAGSVNDGAKINLYTTNRTDWLLSPTFDLSSGSWELVINAGLTNFNSAAADAMGSDDTVQVLVSTNNGASWTPLYTWDVNNQPPTAGQPYIIDLSAYTGATNRFAIWATDGTVDDSEDYDFHIGDFEIRTPPSCAAPANLSSTAYSTFADLDWTQAGTPPVGGWEIEYGPSPLTPGNGTKVLAATKPYTLTGLTTTTDYEYYVRAICAVGDSSTWAGPSSFTTTVACPEPSALSATNITATTAELNWTENALATDWIIEYGPAPLTPGTGTMVQVGTKPHMLTGLTTATAYEYYVRSYCGAGDSSIWVGPLLFSTNCLPFTATYTQNFDGAPAVAPFGGIPCWRATGPGANDVHLSATTDDGAAIPSGPNVVELNDGTLSSGDSAILVSPEFSDLGTGLNRIRFMAHQEVGGAGDLHIGLMSDPTDAATFVPYDTITSAELNATAGFEEYTINFDNVAAIGSNRHIAFVHGSDIYELYVDDFVYEPIPLPGDVQVTEGFTMMTDYCGTDSIDVAIVFTNNTSNSETNIPFTGSVNGLTQSGVYPVLGPNATDTLVVRIPTPVTGVYNLMAWTELPNDLNVNNDTSATITVYVSHLASSATVTSNYNGADISCNGAADGEVMASITTAGLGNVTYMWLGNSSTTATATGLPAGMATVVLTDSIGCIDSAMIMVTEPTAVDASVMDNGNGSATASAVGGTGTYSFVWDNGATTATATGLTSGMTHCVSITDANNCQDTACVFILVTGLDDIQNTTNTFKVYPNPTTGKVFVELGLDTPTDVQLTVYNAIGENVMSKQLNGQSARIELNTGELPTGVYMMRFEIDNEVSTQKLIIQRP